MRRLIKNKSLHLAIVASFFSLVTWAQKPNFTGTVVDGSSKEPLIGAMVIYGPGKAAQTAVDGSFQITLEEGQHQISVQYFGYNTVQKTVDIKPGKTVEMTISMDMSVLATFEVVSDIAKERETPVAFSNVTAEQIREQLGTQDLPMLLNTTPGVYVSQKEGGDGQADVRIRGFSSQNVLTLIDGIPMNDMYNGRLYWSNWGGIGNNTKLMQVQRGLGATKLAIPSVGGSINVITQGIESEKHISIRQDFGNRLNAQTVISGATGRLKGDWNIQGSLAFKYNQGWVDATNTMMFAYYIKVNKEIKKHAISFTAFGGPQWANQRSYLYPFNVATYDGEYAAHLGMDTVGIKSQGLRYNRGWGYLARTRDNEDGPNAESKVYNVNYNPYYKPIFSLQDLIKVNDKLLISLTAYASFGIGGGTNYEGPALGLDANGQLDLQSIYNNNAYNTFNAVTINGEKYQKASGYIKKDFNNHSWYGALATFDYAITHRLKLSGGLDLRYYNGSVYSRIYDLLGADILLLGSPNPNEPTKNFLRVGDLIRQNLERDVLWGGAFAMLEYKTSIFSAFVNVSGAVSAYNQYNHLAKKQLTLKDTVFNIGYYDTISYNGQIYNAGSKGLKLNQSGWVVRPGFTVKGGGNVNLGKNHNVFVNVGYFSRAPYMNNLVTNANALIRNVKNENVASFELGYGMRYSWIAMSLNAYYTLWYNKPQTASLTDPSSGNTVVANINGIRARHVGGELDFVIKPIKYFDIEGSISIGDWVWDGVGNAQIIDEMGNVYGGEKQIDMTGVKVGDQPQRQYSMSLRIKPFKGFYISPQVTLFTHFYTNYYASYYTVNEKAGIADNFERQQWRIPDYYLFNINMGYGFKVKKVKIDLRANFINVTNNTYISDAFDQGINFLNEPTFSAFSAQVNLGMGFRWMGSIQVRF